MKETLTIEKGIPIPAARHRHPKYPFRDMEVGDSIFIPHAEGKVFSFGNYIKDNAIKICQRKVDGGTRVWRIA